MGKKFKDSIFYDKEPVIGMDETMMSRKHLLEQEVNDLIHTANAKRGEEKVIQAQVTGITYIGNKPAAVATFGSKQIECIITEDDFMEFPKYDPKYGYVSEKKMHSSFMQSAQRSVIDIVLLPPKPDPNTKKLTNNIREIDGNIYAFCSRKLAMDRQYKDYWLKKYDGKRVINEGCLVMARVVRVANSCAYMECYGVEFEIPLRELSWTRLDCAQDAFSPGKIVKIRILEIQYSDDEENVRPFVVASVKAARENPQIAAFPRVNINSSEAGEVKNPHNGKFFVTLERTEAEVLCEQGEMLFRTPMSGDKCIVRIDGKDEETLKIWGTIVRVEEMKPDRPKYLID